MLVLSRKRHQSILIGESIRLTVLESAADEDVLFDANVRLGFQAPKQVQILREEVHRRMNSSGGGNYRPKIAEKIAGRSVFIPNAKVRMRVELPENRWAVRCFGVTKPPSRVADGISGDPLVANKNARPAVDGRSEIEVIAHKDARIEIGDSITILLIGVFRFVSSARAASDKSRLRS